MLVRRKRPTYGEEDKILLVVLSDAVVYPGTVVVHFAHAASAHGTMVSPGGLETIAFGALVGRLTGLQV